MLIFLRPRLSSIQKRYPQLSYMHVLYFATFAYDHETRRQVVLDKIRQKEQETEATRGAQQPSPQSARVQSSMTSQPSVADSKLSSVEILTSILEKEQEEAVRIEKSRCN